MATVKVKLRPSSVEGKAGAIFYQITHNRKIQQIKTKLRVLSSDCDSDKGQSTSSAPNCSMIQNRVESDVALLKRVIACLDDSGTDYSVADVVRRYQSPQSHILVLDYMRTQIEQLRAAPARNGAKQRQDDAQLRDVPGGGEAAAVGHDRAGDCRVQCVSCTEEVGA